MNTGIQTLARRSRHPVEAQGIAVETARNLSVRKPDATLPGLPQTTLTQALNPAPTTMTLQHGLAPSATQTMTLTRWQPTLSLSVMPRRRAMPEMHTARYTIRERSDLQAVLTSKWAAGVGTGLLAYNGMEAAAQVCLIMGTETLVLGDLPAAAAFIGAYMTLRVSAAAVEMAAGQLVSRWEEDSFRKYVAIIKAYNRVGVGAWLGGTTERRLAILVDMQGREAIGEAIGHIHATSALAIGLVANAAVLTATANPVVGGVLLGTAALATAWLVASQVARQQAALLAQAKAGAQGTVTHIQDRDAWRAELEGRLAACEAAERSRDVAANTKDWLFSAVTGAPSAVSQCWSMMGQAALPGAFPVGAPKLLQLLQQAESLDVRSQATVMRVALRTLIDVTLWKAREAQQKQFDAGVARRGDFLIADRLETEASYLACAPGDTKRAEFNIEK